MTLQDSREMNYDRKLQNMSWFCYNMWTCCPRQTLSHGSLTIKHYRVQVGNHNRGYWSPCIRHALKKELLLLEQINQWLGVLGNTNGVEVINLPNHRIHSHMHNWLGMVPEETKTIFLVLTVATCNKCTWIRGSHYLHLNIFFMSRHEENAYTSFQH